MFVPCLSVEQRQPGIIGYGQHHAPRTSYTTPCTLLHHSAVLPLLSVFAVSHSLYGVVCVVICHPLLQQLGLPRSVADDGVMTENHYHVQSRASSHVRGLFRVQ